MSPTYRNPGRIEFRAEIRLQESGGAFVEFPYDVERLFGVRGRVPVNVTFDGISYRGSMVKMRSDRHLLLILKDIRNRLGKGGGDEIHVTVELDEAPRVVNLSRDIAAAFEAARVFEEFRAMSYSHQREYVLWIEDAKRPETRARRIAQAIVRIRKAAVSRRPK